MLSPFLNHHRPCLFPTEQRDHKGKINKRYRDQDIATPYEKLKSLPNAATFLKPGVTFQHLDAIAYAQSDLDAARAVNAARDELFRTIGYRRIPRVGERPAHLEVFEHEAAIVRRIFDDYVHKDLSMGQIANGLNYDGISSPSGRAVWGVSTIARILRNDAYIGRVYANRTEAVPDRRLAGKTRQVQRPRDQWIAIAVPAVLDEELFEAAQRVSRNNSQWSPRRVESGYWLLRGLVKCGHCAMSVSCHKMRGRNGTFHRYYYCRNHDPLRAGGEHRRCPERNIRAGELDAFVFEQVRDALLRPDVLLSGEHAVSARREPAADELLQAQLA